MLVATIQTAIKEGKIMILCVVLTVILLRGMMSSSNSGSSSSGMDPDLLKYNIERNRKVLNHIHTGGESNSNSSKQQLEEVNPNSYETFNFTTLLAEDENPDEEEVKKKDPNKAYSLGPKISDWDEQRAEWLKQHPEISNYIKPKKPRVMLVTGSSPKPCQNRVGDYYLVKSIKNKIDYCRIHGIEILYNMALLDAEMSGFWAKLPLIRSVMVSHPEVEFVWWMDSDAMFTDMKFEIPWERYNRRGANLVIHGWNKMVYEDKNWIGLNTGSFLLRNSQWGLDLLDAWAPMGPEGKVRDEAGELLAKELKGRPVFEADDQSAMVYLLATEREKWGEKVYLESGYYLHGYWGIIVDRYEEMMDKNRPGSGDEKWPLVTHFVGCKPCGKVGDYPVERCLKQMERAFNFGDNQILQMYGFRHKSLSSRRIKRVSRNETTVGEFGIGLLHPSFN